MFEYKIKIIGTTSNNNSRLNAELVVSWKNYSNFSRSLDLPLINYWIELDLIWTRSCVISEVSIIFREVDPNADPVEYEVATLRIGATCQINNAKLYVPVVTLSINGNIKFLENAKQGFKRTIPWNKYRSGKTTQSKDNNSQYLIDPTLSNINRLFLLLFTNDDDDPARDSFE